jgi:hypothetical protein
MSQLTTEIGATIRTIVKYGVLLGIVYYVFRSIEVLAGRQTGANIIFAILGEQKVACSIAFLFGGGGAVYGWRQNRQREHLIQKWAPKIAEEERKFDPGRDSSGLDDRGRTPEDYGQ